MDGFPSCRLLIACALALTGTLHAAAPPADAAAGHAQSLSDRNQVVATPGAGPRRLGYVVGDVIDRRVVVSAPTGYVLERPSLPKLGPENVWLALIQTSVRDRGTTPMSYEIDLRYQLINAPTEVRSLSLPAFHVRFAPAQPREPGSPVPAVSTGAAIEERTVRIAPILPAHVPVSAALLRPDRPPRALSSSAALFAAVVSTVLAVGIVAALIAQPIFRRRNGPFARAHRRLRRTVRRAQRTGAAPARVYPSALRIVHRAFDQTAGWSLFPDRVSDFLAQWRQFADLRGGIERFLEMSQREFFECRSQEDSQRESRDLRWLLEFTHECRARERRAS
jgi:mxaA protein